MGYEWTNAQKKIIERSVVGAEVSGIALEGEKRERFNELTKQMTKATTQFSKNMAGSAENFYVVFHDKKDFADEDFPEG